MRTHAYEAVSVRRHRYHNDSWTTCKIIGRTNSNELGGTDVDQRGIEPAAASGDPKGPKLLLLAI